MSSKVWTDVELASDCEGGWDCDIRLLHKMLREKRLRGFKVGRAWRITDEAKREYEDRQAAKQGAA